MGQSACARALHAPTQASGSPPEPTTWPLVPCFGLPLHLDLAASGTLASGNAVGTNTTSSILLWVLVPILAALVWLAVHLGILNRRNRRTADALRESERRFRMLAENIPGVVYLCRNDERYTMLFLNDAVEPLTGFPKEDFLADRISFVELYHPDDAEAIAPLVDAALEERRPFELEYRLKRRDGRDVWVYEIGVGVFDDAGSLQYLEGYLHDFTARKRAEDERQLLVDELNHRVANALRVHDDLDLIDAHAVKVVRLDYLEALVH